MEAHVCNFVFNALWYGKPVQLFQERCRVVMTRCHEDESCSKVLNFLERLDDRIGLAHEETVTVIKPWDDLGGNKSFGCIFSEKSSDWTDTFELEISGLTDLYDVFLHGQFWVKNESKVPNRIRERDVVTTGSNGVREGNGAGLRWRKEGEKKSFCFVVVEFELIWLSWLPGGHANHWIRCNVSIFTVLLFRLTRSNMLWNLLICVKRAVEICV